MIIAIILIMMTPKMRLMLMCFEQNHGVGIIVNRNDAYYDDFDHDYHDYCDDLEHDDDHDDWGDEGVF